MKKAVIKEVVERFREKGPVISIFVDMDRSKRNPKEIAIEVKNIYKTTLQELARWQVASESEALRAVFESLFPEIEGCVDGLSKGKAFYVNAASGLFAQYSLPVAVPTQVRVANHPRIFPLMEILSPHKETLAVIVGAKEARFFRNDGEEVKMLLEVAEDVPAKVKAAGWYGLEERRIERHVEEHILRHLKATTATLKSLVEEEGNSYDLVLVGGNEEYASVVVELAKEATVSVPVEIASELGNVTDPESVREAIFVHTMRRFYEEGEALVGRILTEASKGGQAITGLSGTLKAVNMGAVHQLVVDEHRSVKGGRCDHCDILVLEPSNVCPVCEASVTVEDDLLEAVAHKVLEQDGDVTVLGRPSLLRECEGLGAVLRFPIS